MIELVFKQNSLIFCFSIILIILCLDKLQHNAAQFEQHAGKLKRKFWWKNMKVNKRKTEKISPELICNTNKKPTFSLIGIIR